MRHADAVRAFIANRLAPPLGSARIGGVTLAPHQIHAARRASALLALERGALLADDVGLGKTYVALAIARMRTHVLVVTPAALRAMWTRAAAATALAPTITTYEALSRGHAPRGPVELVILDEAHHARSPHAARYAAIARLARDAHVLLLTATPLGNRLSELRALFALFMGDAAHTASLEQLQALIVRRTSATVGNVMLPAVDPPKWIVPPQDDGDTIARIASLPPAVATADGGRADALLVYSLARQWASSRGALLAALRRRAAHAIAIAATLDAGRRPTRHECTAWVTTDDAVQLALPALLAPADALERPFELASVHAALARHARAIEALVAQLARDPHIDAVRAELLRAIRRAHPDRQVLAFTEFAETVDAYWRVLRHDPGVARLSARGGEIASGRISREDVLGRFAPLGQGVPAPAPHAAVALLLTTDLLSEGVDLRDATVVVHLDLPWSPMRLEQRVGRARRLGSAADRIIVYAFRPSASAEQLLAIERRLRRKAVVAARAVGLAGTILPRLVPEGLTDGLPATHLPDAPLPPPDSLVEQWSRMVDRVLGWSERATTAPATRCGMYAAGIHVGVVHAGASGWLALVRRGTTRQLVARLANVTAANVQHVERAVDCASSGAPLDELPDAAEHVRFAMREAEEWAEARGTDALVHATYGSVASSVRRRAVARVDSVFAALSPATRGTVAPIAAAARAIGALPLPLARERDLAVLIAQADDAPQGDVGVGWLRAVADLAADTVPHPVAAGHGAAQVEAVIVFICTAAGECPGQPVEESFSSSSDAELMQ